MNNIQTLKGFRDFLPEEAARRRWVTDLLRIVFESYGFEPLETPALEYEEILMGKYGEEGDKLMYRFEDNGGRKVALRYDQTVPLARVVAQYGQNLGYPFKRYQMQPVWRAENTQKGRFREFMQCDIDTVGSDSPLADAEVIKVVNGALQLLGFKKYKILVSSRNLLFKKIEEAGIDSDLAIPVIRVIDKIKKIGREGCFQEIANLGIARENVEKLDNLLADVQPNEDPFLGKVWTAAQKMGVVNLEWYPYLARGMDYYTGTIFEVEIEDYTGGSVGGGGRYDNLVGIFSNKTVPAVGFAFGFDRLLDAMAELKMFPENLGRTDVLITIFSPELLNKSIEVMMTLRDKAGAATVLYVDEKAKLDKQLKYASQKNYPYAAIIGPDEAEKGLVVLKDMKSGEQEKLTLEELIKKFL